MSKGCMRWQTFVLFGGLLVMASPSSIRAQDYYPAPGEQGSSNIEILAHLPGLATDIEIEQDMARPYVYVSRGGTASFDIISVEDPDNPEKIYTWQIENPELHQGSALDGKYFKLDGRYYYVQSVQFRQSGPDYDLGAIVFDVTGLPDPSQVREVARMREPLVPGGFHNIFAYKHSNGQVLLYGALLSAMSAFVYDMAMVLNGEEDARIAEVPRPTPEEYRWRGYHDYYVAYHPESGQDRFYGSGLNGYYVFDVTHQDEPSLLTSVTNFAGVDIAHTFTPTPDGRYAVGEMEYQHAPLLIFDLKPGLDGEVPTITRAIGAWTAKWQNLMHNHEVRWPYVFVSGYRDGLQVFNMMDPTNPYTVAYYDTYEMPDIPGQGSGGGTFGVDVRNADGLIVTSGRSGVWAFKMSGFEGWNGNDWGMPNISSVQDWDNGPEGAPSRPIS